MYRELQWRFSKVENYSGVSQIRGNCSGVYPINPIYDKVPWFGIFSMLSY
jgi:hypothetical protein